MAKTESEADTIIATLKSRRDAMDAANAAKVSDWRDGTVVFVDGNGVDSSAVQADRLASLSHADERDEGVEVCAKCALKYDDDGLIIGTLHFRHNIVDLRAALIDGTMDVDDDGYPVPVESE